MQCPQCQHENPAGARFCNACGSRLEAVCAACGQANPLGSRFCNACGQNLVPPAPAASAPRFAAPQAYTPQYLAEKILTFRQALALAEELGMRPFMAHCHLGLGMLDSQIGRTQQARAELTTAIDLYRTMDMTFWLPQAEAALAKAE